ncbi:putative E3 ubiquitin-protein ligase ARI6 isoform X2 [Salmo trutta]|uniref:Putative E3 ubiquitin-protein ligase ARI6 n=1 Tax=Salmo trutta TaxID=8032 RepID=A0A673WBE5_SALTR|nr:putative E3 ubiquitin-protein ligase ARI6 isoform X2 [Salmo trutta]
MEDEKSYDPGDRTLKFVNRQDDITLDDDPDSLRAEMSCGHAVTPQSLTGWCKSLLADGQHEFICPALNGNQKCGAVWSYQEVRRLAALTAQEIQYFEETIATLASPKVKSCPGCKSLLVRMNTSNLNVHCPVCSADKGQTYQFCWQCLNQWKGRGPRSDHCDNTGCSNQRLQLLQNCPTVTLPQVHGVTACPSIRACPTCGALLEHDKTACKNLFCPRCKKEFCFVCLKLKSECMKTSSPYKACSAGVAPRQTSIPTWSGN